MGLIATPMSQLSAREGHGGKANGHDDCDGDGESGSVSLSLSVSVNQSASASGRKILFLYYSFLF